MAAHRRFMNNVSDDEPDIFFFFSSAGVPYLFVPEVFIPSVNDKGFKKNAKSSSEMLRIVMLLDPSKCNF